MKPTKIHQIFVFRHGETDWNREGRIQGHLDIPLNETGRAQARFLQAPAARLGIQAILSSDLSRARETADIIAAPSGIPVFSDVGLREIYLGKVQGLNRDEIIKTFGETFSSRLRSTPLSDSDVTQLGSESGEDVTQRALAAITRFVHAHSFDRFGVATHGGVIRRLLQHAIGDGAFPAPIPNGVFYPIQYDSVNQRWCFITSMPLQAFSK